MALLGGLWLRDRRRSNFTKIGYALGFEEALHCFGVQGSGRDLDIGMGGSKNRLDEVPCAEFEDVPDSLGRRVLDQEIILLIPSIPVIASRARGDIGVLRHNAPLEGKVGHIGPKLLKALECGVGANTGSPPDDGIEPGQAEAAAEDVAPGAVLGLTNDDGEKIVLVLQRNGGRGIHDTLPPLRGLI